MCVCVCMCVSVYVHVCIVCATGLGLLQAIRLCFVLFSVFLATGSGFCLLSMAQSILCTSYTGVLGLGQPLSEEGRLL